MNEKQATRRMLPTLRCNLSKLLPSSRYLLCCNQSDSSVTRRITLEKDQFNRISSVAWW